MVQHGTAPFEDLVIPKLSFYASPKLDYRILIDTGNPSRMLRENKDRPNDNDTTAATDTIQ